MGKSARTGMKQAIRAMESARRALSEAVFDEYGGVVQAGPLAGVKLIAGPGVRAGTMAAKIWGLYEQQVLNCILSLRQRDVLVCIGAADGYFGVGLVAAGMFRRSICFEAQSRGRRVLEMTAAANGVADRVEILGAADRRFPDLVEQRSGSLKDLVFLIDAEGAEYELLSDPVLDRLSLCHLIIEQHPWLARDPAAISLLVAAARDRFACETLHGAARDLSHAPQLLEEHENIAWAACSEGRGRMMEWLHLSPQG